MNDQTPLDRDASIAFAQKYLEDILSFFGLNTVVTASAEEDVIELNVPSSRLNSMLIGQHGETLRSLQSLISTTLKNREAELYRVNLDISGYKKQRNEKLLEQVPDWVAKARDNGRCELPPMNAAERRVVHQAVADYSDIVTESEGEGRERHIVLSLTD